MNIALLSKIFRSLVALSFLSLFVFLFLDMNFFIKSKYDLSPMLQEANVGEVSFNLTKNLIIDTNYLCFRKIL